MVPSAHLAACSHDTTPRVWPSRYIRLGSLDVGPLVSFGPRWNGKHTFPEGHGISSAFIGVVDHGCDLSAILTLESGIVDLIVQSAVAPSVFSEGGKILIQDSFEVNDRASDSG
jgi:hypothetical protein